MKKIFIILLTFISITLNATKYYVATDGSNSNPGTLAEPWLTWHYAFNNTTPGDTCYFRGGVYTDMYNASIGAQLNTESRDGTHSNPTCYFAYPDDWTAGNYPILDCISLTGQYKSGVYIAQASHLYIKGLTVRNIDQESYTTQVRGGFNINDNFNGEADYPNDIRVENCVVHDANGTGFGVLNCDTVYIINCDSYNICDSLSTLTAYDPGGWGTGFSVAASTNEIAYIYLYGCRAWNCSDQGFSGTVMGYIEWDHCWAIHNGFFQPTPDNARKGSGWKCDMDYTYSKNTAILQTYIHNCLAVDNEIQGFTTNDGSDDPEFRGHWYNNFAYRNGHTHADGTRWGAGFIDFARNPSDTVGIWDHLYSNNISYNNWGLTPSAVKTYPGDYLQSGCMNYDRSYTNYLDVSGTTVTDADFVSLDTTGLCGPRESDFSLPITTFGTLSETSNLIDAGTDVGIDYIGDAPDVGYVEYFYEEEPPASIPLLYTTVPFNVNIQKGTSGGSAISDGGAAITVKGVCWSTSADPTTADSKTEDGDGEGDFTSTITGLSSSTTYHVRGYAINSEGTGYGADEEFTTPDWGVGWQGGKAVYYGDKIVIVK